MGFRVSLIVVSAYTSAGFISNTPEDFGSVIRFIEHNFNIMEGALTFADARGTGGDLTEFFSLGNAPGPFQTINAPLSAQYLQGLCGGRTRRHGQNGQRHGQSVNHSEHKGHRRHATAQDSDSGDITYLNWIDLGRRSSASSFSLYTIDFVCRPD